MGILLAFAPFIVFAIGDRLVGPVQGLIAGAFASAVLIGRDLAGRRTPKILEVGTAILFGGLCLVALTFGLSMSVLAVRLCVDAGLLVIVLLSMAIGRPFTLQYARDQVPAELWLSREFIRTNYVITAVWALAFAIMTLAEAVLVYVPAAPRRLGIVIIVLALVGATKFTGWYPGKVRRDLNLEKN